MIDLLTKDEQGTGYTPRPRKSRRKLSKLERLRLAIVAHMREQRKAVTKWAAAQTTLPYSFPDWNHFKLGALKMTERMTPIISAIWDASGTKFASRVGLDPNQWSVVNPHTAHRIEHAALAFCEETNKSTSTDIQSALDRLRVHLHEGIVNEGESVEQLTKRVQAVFDTATKSRARTIAQTETSRAVHAAQDDAAHKSGVVTGWRWLLSSDACPVCVAIAARNPTVQLGQPFAIIGKNPSYSHIYHPPAHPRCLLPETAVCAPGLRGGISANYDGPVVRLRFANGSDISITPHHILLTPTGFAFAESLVEGDDVLSYLVGEWPAFPNPYHNGEPATAEQIVASLAVSGGVPSSRVPVSPEYLHGDAAFCDGDINVVWTDRLVRGNDNPSSNKAGRKQNLERSNIAALKLSSDRLLAQVLISLRDATDRGMSSRRERQAFCWGLARSLHACSVGSAADHYAGFEESITDSRASDSEDPGQLKFRLPSNVASCKIINVDTFHYIGPVYDVQTESSLCIIGNCIISSNCNCTAQEILDIDTQPVFSVAPLVDPEAATEQELQAIRQQRHERDEAILRGSEAWGAAPYVERYPTGRPLPQKPPKRIRKLAKSFDEAQHPRDELGRFAASGHSFTSHEEAHRWASLTFPNANVETTGIHHETWSKIARVVHSVLSKFPGIAERVKSFGAEEMHPSLIAAATVGGSRSLNFNTLWWGNPNKLDAALKINVRDGYNPPGVEHAGIEYYVSHEMGHLIDGYMEEKDPAVWKALQRRITLPLKPGRRIADLDRNAAATVSQYAATSTQEAFAEAYAASRHQKDPSNAIVQAFGSLIP